MSQETLISSKSLMFNLLKKLKVIDEEMEWVKCRLCGEQWSKLLPCEYYLENSSKPLQTYACLDCGEGFKSIQKIMDELGLVGVRHSVGIEKNFIKLKAEMRARSNYFMVIEWHGRSFRILARSITPCLAVIDAALPEEINFFDNIFQVMSFIKRQLFMVGL